MTDLAEKLLWVRHNVSLEPHIVLDNIHCVECELKPCLYICSAGCFTEEEEEIKLNYEGCMECGTCRVVCPHQSLTWNYPPGGFGVSFRYG